MRLGFERLGGLVRERMGREPKTKALFVFFGRRRYNVKILTWDGTGMVLIYKRLDAGAFEVPVVREGETSVVVSELMLEQIMSGVSTVPAARIRPGKKRIH